MVLICLPALGWAQVDISALSVSDSSNVWFDENFGRENTGVYEGRYEAFTIRSWKSHPFYGTSVWQDAEVIYKGKIFREVPVRFNLETQELFFKYPNIQLDNEYIRPHYPYVEYFKVNDEKFIWIEPEQLLVPNGLYKVCYEGEDIRILARYTKQLEIVKSEQEYVQSVEYFASKGDKYIRVTSLRTFLRMFRDHKREIRSFIKSEGLMLDDRGLEILGSFLVNLT